MRITNEISLRRRPEEDQIQAIYAATVELLEIKGFESLTMGDIASRARMSKQTLYKHFSSKEELLAAFVRSNAAHMNKILEELLVDKSLPLEVVLSQVGKVLLQLLTSEKSILINRVAISCAFTKTDMSEILFEHGRQLTLPKMEALIENTVKKEKLKYTKTFSGMAEIFVSLMVGDLQIRCLLGLAATPDATEIDMRVKRAVEQFICLLK